MQPEIVTQETFTRYRITDGDTVTDNQGVDHRITRIEVTRNSNAGIKSVVVLGQRLRADGEDDTRSRGATLVQLPFATLHELTEQVEQAAQATV